MSQKMQNQMPYIQSFKYAFFFISINYNMLIEIERKKEYSTHLINILVPHIYDGICSIYQDAKTMSKNENTIITFQHFLRRCPNWANELVEIETKRIKKSSLNGDILDNLLKAVIKSNIRTLSDFNYNSDQLEEINKFYDSISLCNFVHKCYIQTCRTFYNYADLFYTLFCDTNVSSIEKKKTQREIITLIKESIEISIKDMLPFKLILDDYLIDNINISLEKKSNSPHITNHIVQSHTVTHNETAPPILDDSPTSSQSDDLIIPNQKDNEHVNDNPTMLSPNMFTQNNNPYEDVYIFNSKKEDEEYENSEAKRVSFFEKYI